MATTLTTENLFDGTSSQQTFTITFPYLQQADVKVEHPIGTILSSSGYTFLNATQIQFTTTATGTNNVRIYRDTIVDSAKAVYATGSSIRATDLNNNEEHLLFSSQEKIYTSDIAADSITGVKIADDSIDSEHLVDGSIDGVHIANDAIDSQHYADNSIDTEHYAPNSVDTNAIADNTIDSSHYVDGSIDHEHLASNIIEADNIKDDAIDSQHYVADSIDTEHYAPGSVDAAAIATGALDGRYYTETELDAGQLDSRYFTETESDARYYQISSSDDIQSTETWVVSDTKVPTTKAVDARVITLVDEVGGFVPITNESDFPATNPDINSDAGTIVSIGVLNASYTSSGSGVITIPASTLDNLSNDLTITGAANSTTYGPNFGMLVETKALSDSAYAAAPSYTFHRLLPKASEVTTLAGKATELGRLGTADAVSDLNTLGTADVVTDMNTLATGANVTAMSNCSGSIANINTTASNIANVNNFSGTYQIASSAPANDGNGAALAAGDLYFNTSSSELKVRNAANDAWQGGVTATGSLISKGGDEFTGAVGFTDGSTSAPSIYNVGDTNTGIYFGAADEVDVTVGGSTKLEVNSTGIDVTGNIVVSGTVDGIDVSTLTATPEGTAVISTGESGGTKFLREDGDGTCSWQTVTQADTTYTQAANDAGSGNVNLRLTAGGSGSGNDDILVTAGTNVTIGSISAAGFTISATDTNTTYAVVDASAAGLAPTLPGSHGGKFLRGDGTWVVPTDTNTQVAIDDTPVNGVTDEAISSNWAFDHNAATGNSAHVPAAGSSGQFLAHNGAWATPPDTDTTTPADDSVTGAKLSVSLVEGDVLYGSGTDTLARLAKGSAGEVLKMNSGATAPEWGAASVGTITALNNQTADRLTTIGSTTTQLDGEANLTFNDATTTGLICGKQITGRGFECPAEVSDDWTIAADNNAMFPGPMTIASAKTVTVPAGRTLTIV